MWALSFPQHILSEHAANTVREQLRSLARLFGTKEKVRLWDVCTGHREMWCPVWNSAREENFPSMYSDFWEMSIGWLVSQVFKKQLSKVHSQAFWVSYRSWTFLRNTQEPFAQPTVPCPNLGTCRHICSDKTDEWPNISVSRGDVS